MPADAALVAPTLLSPAPPAPKPALLATADCPPAETPPSGLERPADPLFENPPWKFALVTPLALAVESPVAGRSEALVVWRSSRRSPKPAPP